MKSNKNSTKNLIISLLGKQFPLTLKQIFDEIKITRTLSYQALHKGIKELVDEGIVDKIEKQYFLNKNWVREQTKSYSYYYSNYFSSVYNPKQIDASSRIQVFRFTSVKEFLDFLIDSYVRDQMDQEDHNIHISVRRISPFIPHSLLPFIKKLCKQKKIHVLCRSDTAIDRAVAKFYKSLGVNIRTGAVIPHYNNVCFGDLVFQYFFFFNEAYRKKLNSFSQRMKGKSGLSLLRITSDILYRKTEIHVVVNRHPLLLDEVKQAAIDEFNLQR